MSDDHHPPPENDEGASEEAPVGLGTIRTMPSPSTPDQNGNDARSVSAPVTFDSVSAMSRKAVAS